LFGGAAEEIFHFPQGRDGCGALVRDDQRGHLPAGGGRPAVAVGKGLGKSFEHGLQILLFPGLRLAHGHSLAPASRTAARLHRHGITAGGARVAATLLEN
jgi:hypothetical protein